MAASPEFVESLNRSAECKICFGRLRNPKILHCFPYNHSFCKQCLDGLLEFNQDGSAIVRCPNRCKNGTVKIGANETTEVLPRSYDLINILEILEKAVKPPEQSICEKISCVNATQFLCIRCKSKYCYACYENHICDRKHPIPIYYDENSEKFFAICEQHQSLALIACIKCGNKMMCTYCFHRNHDRTHLHDNINHRADATRDTLKSGLTHVIEYFKKTKFSYADQLNCIEEIGNNLEMESKANLAREVVDFINAAIKKHEHNMNRFYAAVMSHQQYLENHEFLNGNMETVASRFREKVDKLKDVDLLADRWNILEEIKEISSIRCFSLQVNESLDMTSKPEGLKLRISTCNASVKADEVIEPISCNLGELKDNETKLHDAINEVQSYTNELSTPTSFSISNLKTLTIKDKAPDDEHLDEDPENITREGFLIHNL